MILRWKQSVGESRRVIILTTFTTSWLLQHMSRQPAKAWLQKSFVNVNDQRISAVISNRFLNDHINALLQGFQFSTWSLQCQIRVEQKCQLFKNSYGTHNCNVLGLNYTKCRFTQVVSALKCCKILNWQVKWPSKNGASLLLFGIIVSARS